MVITVEPGIDFIESLLRQLHDGEARTAINWDTVDAMRPFGGIRIEDNVAVVDNGSKNLTRDS